MASVGDGRGLTTGKQPTKLLIAVSALALVVGVLGFVLPNLVGSQDKFAADRQNALTRASDFAVTFNTYSVEKKADYQRRMKPLMTPKYYKDYLEITNAMFQVIKDKDQSSGDAQVLSAAVDSIDADSAVVILAINTQVHRSDSEAAIARRFRWRVTLTKTGQKWLVNEFDSVPIMQASVGDVTDKDGADK